MTHNAYVHHEFKKGFLLKDEDLTKLLDIIKNRSAEVKASDLVKIRVYRVDSLIYETLNLDALRGEENAVRNLLTRVQVVIQHQDLNVDFDFKEREGVSIEIESTERDRAYLLFSELKEYLNTEVLVLRGVKKRGFDLFEVTFPTLLLGGIVFFILYQLSVPPLAQEQMNSLLAGEDIHAKLNYMIEDGRKTKELGNLVWLMPLAILGIAFPHAFVWLRNKWYPTNIFYFGKEKQRYDLLIQRRAQWFWGVFVAFLIGIASSYAFLFLSKSK